MPRIPRASPVIPQDPEIERTFRARRRSLQRASNNIDHQEEPIFLFEHEELEYSDGETESLRSFKSSSSDTFHMAQDLRSYGAPGAYEENSAISLPALEATDFELRPALIGMVQRSQFTGSRLESPREHLKTFVDYCSTVKHNGVTKEYIRMALFKFSLIGNARKWLDDLKPNSLTSWNEVTEAFINKYSSPAQTADYRSKMMTFKERTDETLQESWERFNELLRQCTHHGIEMGVLLHCFYHGLSKASRTALDAGAGGPIMKKSLEEVFDIIDDVVRNCEDWNDDRRECDKKGGRYDLEPIHALSTKFDALVTQLQRSNSIPSCPSTPQSPSSVMSCALSCDYCGSFEHPSSYCYPFDQPMEQVNAFNNANNQRFDPYSNTYNPGWRHNPRFSWKDDQTQGQNQFQNHGNGRNQGNYEGGSSSYYGGSRNQNYGQNFQNQGQPSNFQRPPPPQSYQSQGSYQGQSSSSSQFQKPPPPQSFQNPPPGFQRPLLNAPPPQESNIETMLKTFMTQVNQNFDSMATYNKLLETHIAQLSSSNSSRVPGSLPPKGVSPGETYQANAITTKKNPFGVAS